ncbi:hypothetical protein A2Z33_05490 [Candidatus Gottesmanbacteria bacterium RBG_16_52_11]|uniref:Methyltransferase type 11 domain-containing protein n=1 Tax=Candidatus Gottesmanbacteria bacterium RBG_16_52_11 TaxID=1798374 RepID=A0A1F5YNX9_9BACT|nr:MAG: hypothetical protein A2Z33_05490 [Candidatus Gottesmanbacteria bacterium RBG_16_52_11]
MSLIELLKLTPLYPYWLHDRKFQQGNDHVLSGLSGSVLEVGAGSGARKIELLKKYRRIRQYMATDYSSWDGEFRRINKFVYRYQLLSLLIDQKIRLKTDKICDAMNLPFRSSRFDYHLGFEVLEHIPEPEKYISEAYRVLKPGGCVILSVPFLYRMHGGEPDHEFDYYRYSRGFFRHMKNKFGFSKLMVFANTGIGTSIALLINQWLICRIKEAFVLWKILYLVAACILFPVSNILGYLLDILPDSRFSVRFHVKFTK